MPYIPPEVVAKAREMDLYTYLKTYEPQELVHFGGSTYCTREHDSLKISNAILFAQDGFQSRSLTDFDFVRGGESDPLLVQLFQFPIQGRP